MLSRQSFAMSPSDRPAEPPGNFSALFHRLNNQLGVILANAELLELRAADDASRARAAQVVASAIAAMTTARELRALVDTEALGSAPSP
jgi:hypothetical protein